MIKHTVTVLIVVTLLIGLFVASLLGENHKVEALVNEYTKQLTIDSLPDECLSMPLSEIKQTREQCLNNNFIVNLSLLEYFGVLQEDFTVQIRREQFWIPFAVNAVNVSIALVSDNNNDEVLFIKNLFQVNRIDGHWQVINTEISDEKLRNIIFMNQQSIDVEKYIKIDGHDVRLIDQKLDLTKLTPKERYLVKFSTSKLLELIPKRHEDARFQQVDKRAKY
ncbi:hypothetical protein ACMAZF_07775 [Psychrobium sp. nBUS_13]|uniref:hypothetical protein n=1 Tax=Psychrobium sp. nBUS_13 TaxID=3395319 RepID=UPI003EBF20CF